MTSATRSTKAHKATRHYADAAPPASAHAETLTVADVPAASAAEPAAPVPNASLISFASPPPISAVPVPPSGYLAAATSQFRGVLPFQAEQASLAAAIKDLGRIPNYALFVGAPPLAQLIQILTLASEWTDMRNASFKWDQYAATEEGNLWTNARPLMDEFRNAFVQVQKADPTLAAQLPGLTTFLGVRTAIALKAASTKRANKKAEADGKPAQHGQVGKKRKRAAEKAALVAAEASASSAPAPAQASAPTTPAPVVAPAAPGTATS
jgi:hypothetical protein